MVVGMRESLVRFEMSEPKHVSLNMGSEDPYSFSAGGMGAEKLSVDIRTRPGEGRFIGVSHWNPRSSGWSGGLALDSNPTIEAIVYGTDPSEVIITSDILQDPELEEGRFDQHRPGDLITCEARFQTEIPYSLGSLTVHFTTQSRFREDR